MDVDFCPICKKAGLRYKNPDGYYPDDYIPDGYYLDDYIPPQNHGATKWCPRCKEWVKPKARNVMYH